MRLKLNKTLRAALIAAISTVATTLPLAQAWDGGPEDDYGGIGHVYYLNNGKEGVSLTDTGRNSFVVTPNAANVTGEISTITTKDGASVRFTGSNGWHNDWQFSSLLVDTLKAGADGQGTVSVNTQQYNSARPASETTVSILAVSGTLGGVQNYGVLTLGASGSTINASGGFNNHDGATLTINGSYVFDTRDTSKYTLKSEGSVEWSDATYSQGFKKSTGSSYYAIKGATDGANIGSITDSTGTELTRESSGNYYFTAGAGDFDYTKFYVKADTATLDHDGTGQIIVERNGATLTVEHATYRDTSGSKNLNIVVGDGGVLETTHSGVNGFITGTLTINAGGIMRIVGQHDAFGWGSKNQCVASLVMEGTSEKEARLELNQSTGNSATMVTDITMKGYSTITSTKDGGSAGFNTFGCAITAENVQNTIEVLDTRRNGVTITVAKGGELTVKKQTINGSDNSAATVVVKQGEGTLFYTGDTKAKGLNIQAGTVDFSGTADLQALTIGEAGTMKVSGGTTTVGGTANTLSNTIHVTAGTLNLNGTFAIDGNAGKLTKSYGGGENLNNGFCTSSGFIVVYEVEEGGASVVIGQDAQITRGGVDVKAQLVNGVYTASAETDYTNFYVNTDTEKVSKAYSEHTPSTFTLAANTGLTVDQSVTATVTGSGDSSVVTIESDGVLTGTAQNVKIAGSGTYELTSGSTSIGANVSLDAAWTGTVRIHDATVNNVDFKTLVNGTNSTLELMGYSGYPTAWYEQVEDGLNPQNIKLTNGSNGYAFKYTGSTMYDNHVVTFSGNWSGDGTMQTAGNHLNYKFTGDISAWNGKLQVASGIPHVTFSGKATEVNAIIDKNGKTLDLIVGEGSEFSTTFKADVNATSLTVSDNASATFKADATFGSLSGTGKVALDENSALIVSGTVAESVKIDAADGATIDADLDTTQVGIAAHATASFVQGVADGGVAFDGDTPVKVTNCGVETAVYGGIQNEDMLVTADILTADSEAAVAVNNEVVVDHIVNLGEGTLTLTRVATASLSGVSALAGDVTLQNVSTEPVVLEEMSLLGTTVAVYTEGAESPEGTVTITETLTAGGSTLLANLEMADGSKLDVNGGNNMALTLGSQFTIADNALVTLDEVTLAAIAGLENIGDKVILIKQYGDHELTTNLTDGAWARTHFDLSSIAGADYQLYVGETEIGLMKSSNVPEPTTGTLSLLALAGLCARRRRK